MPSYPSWPLSPLYSLSWNDSLMLFPEGFSMITLSYHKLSFYRGLCGMHSGAFRAFSQSR